MKGGEGYSWLSPSIHFMRLSFSCGWKVFKSKQVRGKWMSAAVRMGRGRVMAAFSSVSTEHSKDKVQRKQWYCSNVMLAEHASRQRKL